MSEICLSTNSEIERGYLERWCSRHSVPCSEVDARSGQWTLKLQGLIEHDPRYSLLLSWVAAVPGSWQLDPECQEAAAQT